MRKPRIISEIARGGFGRVEKAQDAFGHIIVVKTFDPAPHILAVSNRETLLKRFVREVKVQSKLPTEYFMPILEADTAADPPWYSMALADRDFGQEIVEARASKGLPKEALSEILNALEVLHSMGFTHRDLKPANVLKHEGRWKLSDFGLVLPDPGLTSTLTSTQSAWGSAPWCAPEQVADFKHVTQSADIFSFGCILHDVLTDGRRIPYRRQTALGSIGAIVEKCTEDDPKKRFKSISSVRDALFKVLSVPSARTASPDAKAWVKAMESLGKWKQDQVDDFIRYVTRVATDDDKSLLFASVDEDVLANCQARDPDLWNTVTLGYCSWCHGTFAFEYCDVLVTRLRYMYDHGEPEIRAAAIMAAADLGYSHNRWHVMGQLMAMCSPQMPDELAQRVAIEILAEDAAPMFIRSAAGISRSKDQYHPMIMEVLES